jgi:hypothetical protein
MNSIRNLIAVAAVALATVVCFHSASAYAINEPVLNQSTRNHYMVLANQPTMFELARQIAEAAGGHLVTIDSRTELQWVLSTFGNVRMYTSTGSIIGSGTLRVVVEFEHLDVLRIAVDPIASHQYRLLAASSWAQADREAAFAGGHLVTIDTPAEAQWVLATFGDNNRSIWTSITNRTMGGMPVYGTPVFGLVEFDDSPAGGNLVAGGSSTLSDAPATDLFSSVGAVTPDSKDAPVAVKKATWGELKARYR